MTHDVKCMSCGKTWGQDKPEHFLTTCGVCAKHLMVYFEMQFQRKLIGAKAIRVEGA